VKAVIYAILSVLSAAVLVGGAVSFAQLSGMKADLATLRGQLTITREQMARLEKRIEETSTGQISPQGRPPGANDTTRRLPDDAGARSPLELSREEIQLLRDYIKLPPGPPGATPTIALGAILPDATLLPLPPQIGEKSPKLIGARFATDRNGAIIIARRGSRRADAIVSPN